MAKRIKKRKERRIDFKENEGLEQKEAKRVKHRNVNFWRERKISTQISDKIKTNRL